jgi:hypothetical protein
MYPDSEILFPARCIPELRNVRPGTPWRDLVDTLVSLPEAHEDVLAFSLMMIRLNNCLTCDLDSYRASLGCGQCARRTIQGFKGNDKELLRRMEDARGELRTYCASVATNGTAEPGVNTNGTRSGNAKQDAAAPEDSTPHANSAPGKARSRGKR